MKKTILLIVAVFSLTLSAYAHPVSVTFASRVAANFWAAHHPASVRADVTPKALPFPELDQLYIFDMDGLGFVIVPADDRVMPVLAYSFDDPFPTSLNRDLAYWLHGYNDQIVALLQDEKYLQRESILQQWGKLILAGVMTDDDPDDNDSLDDSSSDLVVVPAMLQTKWNQSDPYNKFCPYDSLRHGRTVVGCVATAMAQIMKYWNYPGFGQDTHSYLPSSMWHSNSIPRQFANFGQTTYLWQYMPRRISSSNADYQVDAVATLSYHCGVAVDMMYGVSADGGSGAYSHQAAVALRRYFKYDSTIFYAVRDRYNEDDWCALINQNLAQGQPMYYDGSDSTGGHAFVLDGSDIEGRYHFNWGWDGYGNGFYTINYLAPGSGGAGGNATYTFNDDQGAIFGIRPGMVETYDTVDYYDSICSNSPYRQFHEYNLRPVEMDTLLRHLDTIFNYHLKIISQKQVFLNGNYQGAEPKVIRYCPATGFTFPECTFDKEGGMFIGWCSKANGDDTIYSPGQTIFINKNAAYFALWLDDVSIQDADAETTQVSPTVTSDIVNFSVTGEYDATVTVIDSYGRVVKQQTIVGGKAQISLANFPAGAYNIVVTAPQTVYKTRIIKL